jgi:hypothetical protein
MTTPVLADVLYLWWLGQPLSPQLVGVLRWVRRAQHQHAGVSLRYASSWLVHGFAYIDVMMYNMLTVLIIFIIRFHYTLRKNQ